MTALKATCNISSSATSTIDLFNSLPVHITAIATLNGMSIQEPTDFPSQPPSGPFVPIHIVFPCPAPDHLTVNPATSVISVGGAGQVFTTTLYDKNGKIIDSSNDQQIVWQSSDLTVATVNSLGLVLGVNSGTATITAKDSRSGLNGTSTVTVEKGTSIVVAVGDAAGSQSPATTALLVNGIQIGTASGPVAYGVCQVPDNQAMTLTIETNADLSQNPRSAASLCGPPPTVCKPWSGMAVAVAVLLNFQECQLPIASSNTSATIHSDGCASAGNCASAADVLNETGAIIVNSCVGIPGLNQ
jgi:hypothetical protein